MYRLPSRRRTQPDKSRKLNLVPILDSVFILIFFLLVSANFLKIFEINSNVPIVSSSPPPPSKKPPLSLTLEITPNNLVLKSGSNQRVMKSFAKTEAGYPVDELHSFLIGVKKDNSSEKTIIFEPEYEVDYESLVKIMDAVRLLKKTDDAIYTKGDDGVDTRLEMLFEDIIFGNITS
ncbi:MAG: biopolymer transporter ExbD [Halobacteriovoraceae bacterium]|nr:biopolymer transporter ExbD [Halobacteriovoraceae bacterium]